MNKKVLNGLKQYGKEIGIASGDNYFPAIKILREIGLDLYHPITSNVLTGEEKKNRNGNLQSQPSFAYFDLNNKDLYVSIFPPQDFPYRLKNGKIKIAIGAGYDIQVNAGKFDDIKYLNGSFSDPSTREDIMKKQLETMGYKGVNLGIKPVFYPLIANRKSEIKTIDDLKKKEREAVSETPQIAKKFYETKKLKITNVEKAYGGADNQIICFLYSIGDDIVEKGNTLLSYCDKIRLVKNKEGKMTIIIYSTPWIVIREDTYKNDKKFFDDLFNLVNETKKEIEKKEPQHFIVNDVEFEKRFEQKEKELGLN